MASPYDSKYDQIRSRVEFYARRYGIDPAIGVWQIWQESRFSPTACSHANACGIAQFIPGTAARYGVNRNNVESSLDGWGRYMRDLLAMFRGRYDLALAGYNSGENRNEYKQAAAAGRPINWAVMPRGVQTETQSYVNTILGNAGRSPNITAGVVSVPASSSLGTIGGLGTVGLIALGIVAVLLLQGGDDDYYDY